MARDDIEVIQYKILAYLYESLKVGHATALEEVALIREPESRTRYGA